mmetsp:Transcript_71850/g.232712  ORF Transcript_71850/g.232712 Transcript_71850/m.232712 type:complete len:85 (-) Transcript_71850:99-353(-)
MGSLNTVMDKLFEDRKRHFVVATQVQISSLKAVATKLGDDETRSASATAALRFSEDHLSTAAHAVLPEGHGKRLALSSSAAGIA